KARVHTSDGFRRLRRILKPRPDLVVGLGLLELLIHQLVRVVFELHGTLCRDWALDFEALQQLFRSSSGLRPIGTRPNLLLNPPVDFGFLPLECLDRFPDLWTKLG